MRLHLTILGFLGFATAVVGAFIFIAPMLPLPESITENVATLAVISLSAVFLLLVLFLHQMVIRPLRKMVSSISRVNNDGILPHIATPTSVREIRILQEALAGLLKDVQTFRKLEQERSKSKSEFLTVAAHQMRTPLAGLKWMFKTFLSEDLSEKEQKEYLNKGYETVQSLIQLVNNLLNVASIEEGKFQHQLVEKDLIAVLKDVLHTEALFARTKNITTQFSAFTYSILVKIDEEKFRIAFSNLLDNAVKYTKIKGSIRVGVYEYNSSYVDIFVQDDGIGIPQTHRAHMFEKFSRGENALRMENTGSGLGLYLTRNIIFAHGGKIWFESQEGKGTTAHIILPIEDSLIPEEVGV